MSILELVKQAESNAEEQKQQAVEALRQKQDQLKQDTATTIRDLYAMIEKQEQELDALIAKEMEKKQDEIINMYEADDLQVLEIANKKMKKAVHHVVKKVFE